MVYGPMLTGLYAIGLDGRWRFARYEVLVIYPTKHHLAIYRCDLDFLTGGFHREETHEYHYKDVVAVSTTTTPYDSPIEPLDLRDTRKVWDSMKQSWRRLVSDSKSKSDSSDEDGVRFAASVQRRFEIVVSSGDRSSVIVGISDQDNPERQAELPAPPGIDQLIKSVRKMLQEKKGGTVHLA